MFGMADDAAKTSETSSVTSQDAVRAPSSTEADLGGVG